MTLHLWDHKLSYLSVPKCACSSAKMFLHHVQTGEGFQRPKGARSIHQLYPSVPFEKQPSAAIKGHLKIAVVRGPVGRILSAYTNKVVEDHCLHRPTVRLRCMMRGLSLDPTFEEFVTHLSDYRRVSRIIESHTQPLSYFLGEDPVWFDHIISMKHMDVFRHIVVERTGVRVSLGHKNKSTKKRKTADVDVAVRQLLRKQYESDFDIFRPYFSKLAKDNLLGQPNDVPSA